MLWVGFSSGATTGGTGGWPIHIGLAGIDVAKKETNAIWQSKIITSEPVHNVTSLSVNPEAVYLSLANAGIVEFPGSMEKGREYLETPKVIDDKTNLPSNLVTSIVKTDTDFWVAYGDNGNESGIGLYNPGKDIWETVFCSTLKNDSLFGLGNPYVIHAMQIVSPNKMYFLVYDPAIPKVENSESPEGFWVMNTQTHKLKYLGPIWLDWPQRINVEYIDNQLWFKSWFFIIKYNPESEKITKVIGDYNRLVRWYSEKNIPFNIEKDLFISDSFSSNVNFGPYYIQGNLDLSTSTIHNNKLWARLGESQIMIIEKDKNFKDIKIIDNDILEGRPACRFISTPYGLIAIGEGAVGLVEAKE